MSSKTTILKYVLLRIVYFVIPFIILAYIIKFNNWISAIIASIIALCISSLTLHKSRSKLSEEIYSWKHKSHTDDNEAEDKAIYQEDLNKPDSAIQSEDKS